MRNSGGTAVYDRPETMVSGRFLLKGGDRMQFRAALNRNLRTKRSLRPVVKMEFAPFGRKTAKRQK